MQGGTWPRWAGPVTRLVVRWRQGRYTACDDAFRTRARELATSARSSGADRAELAGLLARRDAVALGPHSRPTWTGHRMAVAQDRVHDHLGALDLVWVWPPLWLAMPDSAHTELRAAATA